MVNVDREWAGNGLRFATHQEAEQSARDLMGRWMLVVGYRVDESDDPVNCEWDPSRGNVHLEVVNA
jgi:hypothetical protein